MILGKILWVDLTNGKISVEIFGDAYARKYLGGVGRYGVRAKKEAKVKGKAVSRQKEQG